MTIFIAHCGQQVGNGSSQCGANVVDKMSLAVTRISGNSYKFQLCANMSEPGVYSVYGGNSLQVLQQANLTNTKPRKQGIDAFEAGAAFQVDFLSTDTFFTIYYDVDAGGGNFVPYNQTVLVSPHSIP